MTQPKCKCCHDSPFLWRNVSRLSIFAQDPHIKAATTLSHKQTMVVERKREQGIDIGHIPGISKTERVINVRQFIAYAKAGRVL